MVSARRLPRIRRRSDGRPFVELNSRRIALGTARTPPDEVQREYDRVIGEWLSNGRRLPVEPDEMTVAEVCLAYWDAVSQQHYGGNLDGKRLALRGLRALYGDTRVADFGPRQLEALRLAWVEGRASGCKKRLSRGEVNRRVSAVRQMLAWAANKCLIPHTVPASLQFFRGLREGEHGVRETEGVPPIPEEHVRAVLAVLNGPVKAMVELQLLTGCRPGEARQVRPCDIDQSDPECWVYRPEQHKNRHRGHRCEVFLGPKAQRAVGPFLRRRPLAPCFQPRESEEARLAAREAARVTPGNCGNTRGSNRRRAPKRKPGESYDKDAYARAIARACDKAGVPRFSPNQIRHLVATKLRREHDLETAQVVLGHRNARVTEVYAERDASRAVRVMKEIG